HQKQETRKTKNKEEVSEDRKKYKRKYQKPSYFAIEQELKKTSQVMPKELDRLSNYEEEMNQQEFWKML
ncbi:273_t:CDS:2, partial [Racocetra persica]